MMADEKVTTLLERVFMVLEDGEWQKADEYCEKVLDIDPKNAEAYLGKLMAEYQIKNKSDLINCKLILEDNKYYQKIVTLGNDELSEYVRMQMKI